MKRALVAVTLVLVLASLAFAYSKSRTSQLFGVIVPRVETNEKLVALTFDDGPTPYAVDEILRDLGDAKATFFLIGADMKENPAIAPRLVAAGHEIANHTFHHHRMLLKSPRFVANDIESTDALIRAAGWRGPILFRAPYGKKLVTLPWYLWRHGRIHVTWDVEPDSSARIDRHTEAIVADVMKRVRPGSIVLLHPWYHGRETTRAAIAPLVAGLRARGYRFVTVSELLSAANGQRR